MKQNPVLKVAISMQTVLCTFNLGVIIVATIAIERQDGLLTTVPQHLNAICVEIENQFANRKYLWGHTPDQSESLM